MKKKWRMENEEYIMKKTMQCWVNVAESCIRKNLVGET